MPPPQKSPYFSLDKFSDKPFLSAVQQLNKKLNSWNIIFIQRNFSKKKKGGGGIKKEKFYVGKTTNKYYVSLATRPVF